MFTEGQHLHPNLSKTLKTPEGALAGDGCRLQLAYQWAKTLHTRGKKVYFFGIGHPKAGMPEHICEIGLKYWKKNQEDALRLHAVLEQMQDVKKADLLKMTKESPLVEEIRDLTEKVELSTTPLDDSYEQAAEGFRKFYGISSTFVKPENFLFPIGGAGGLHTVFSYFNKAFPEGVVVTQKPYYTLYAGPRAKNKLKTFDQFEKIPERQGKTFKELIQELEGNRQKINLILFCNPNNPTGRVVSAKEWDLVFETLKPLIEEGIQFYISVDEAYAELKFSDSPFLLEYIFQKLDAWDESFSEIERDKENAFWLEVLRRLIIFRSATKGLSVAGLRMSCTYVGDVKLCEALAKKNREIGDLPTHLRLAYAAAISNFSTRVIDGRLQFLRDFYKEQVLYVWERLNRMGIAVKNSDPLHSEEMVEGTFYVRADFSNLIGHPIKATGEKKKFLNEVGLNITELRTDEDIAYWFLAVGYMMAPISYFGGDPNAGILRITCANGEKKLSEFLDGIERILDSINEQLLVSPHLGVRKSGYDKFAENPASPLLEQGTRNLSKSSSHLPPQIFTEYMRTYWERGFKKAEQCEEIRKNDLKSKIKLHFIQALQETLNLAFRLPSETISKFAAILGNLRCPELNKAIFQVLKFIEYKHPEIFDLYLTFFSDEEGTTSFQREVSDEFEIEPLLEELWVDQELSFKQSAKERADVRDVIAHLAFELILANFWRNGERSPFFKDICEFYAKEPKNAVIEQVVKLKASIDYTHPRGDAKYTQLMAKTLQLWYLVPIAAENLLFFSIEAKALVESVFEKRVVLWGDSSSIEVPRTEQAVALVLCVYGERVGATLEKNQIERLLQELPQLLESNPNLYLVVDESYIERCYDGTEYFRENSLAYLLLQSSSIKKERIIILRSAIGIFSSPDEKISVLTAFDPKILGKFVETSIELHVHAPADLQFGYSYALSDWLNAVIVDPAYASACGHYINLLNKYALAKMQIEEKCTPFSELPHLVSEENNGWMLSMYFKLEKTQKQSQVKSIPPLSLDGAAVERQPIVPQTDPISPNTELQMTSPLLICGFNKLRSNQTQQTGSQKPRPLPSFDYF